MSLYKKSEEKKNDINIIYKNLSGTSTVMLYNVRRSEVQKF